MSIGADNFADAPELDLGDNGPVPSAALTVEAGEPESWLTRTAWWKYTATTDEPLILSLDGSSYPGDPYNADTYLVVYTGSTLADLTYVVYDDDGGDVGYLSKVTLPSPTIGETYYIQVGSYASADDIDYVLTASHPPPPGPPPANDNFADAAVLAPGSSATVDDNSGATTEPGEPNVADYGYLHTVWWTYTATVDGPVEFDVTGSTISNGASAWVIIYSGSTMDALTEIDNGDKLIIDLTAGVTYHLQVGVWADERGSYQIATRELYYGPWRTDAVNNGINVGQYVGFSLNNASRYWAYGGSTPTNEPPFQAVWDLDAGTAPSNTSVGSAGALFSAQYRTSTHPDYDDASQISWGHALTTINRSATYAKPTTGTLPASVKDGSGNWVDPAIVDVQWGPAGSAEPTAQRLTVSLALSSTGIEFQPEGEPPRWGGYPAQEIHLKLYEYDTTTRAAPADPGWMTGAEVAALPTLASQSGTPIQTFTVTDLPIPLTGAATLSVGVIDGWTQQQVVPSPPPSPDTPHPNELVEWSPRATSVILTQDFQVTYRLIYEAPAATRPASPLRQYPRNDGLAGSAKRMWPPARSAQGSLRHGAGTYL